MEDEVDYVLVDRARARSLSVKRRPAGLSVLEISNRKRNIQPAAVFISGILDDSDVSDDGEDSEKEDYEDEIDDHHKEKDDVLEMVGYAYVKKVVEVDRPVVVTKNNVVPKDCKVDDYDEQCWSLLRFRKADLMKLILGGNRSKSCFPIGITVKENG